MAFENTAIVAAQSVPKDYASIYLEKSRQGANAKLAKENRDRARKIFDKLELSRNQRALPFRVDELKESAANAMADIEDRQRIDPMGWESFANRTKQSHDLKAYQIDNEFGNIENGILKIPDKVLTTPAQQLKTKLFTAKNKQEILSEGNDPFGSTIVAENPQTGQLMAQVGWTVPETTIPAIADRLFRPQKDALTTYFQQQGRNQDFITTIASTIPQTAVQARRIEAQNKLPAGTITSFEEQAEAAWTNPDVQHLTMENHRSDLTRGNKLIYSPQETEKRLKEYFISDFRKSIPVDIKIQDRAIPQAAANKAAGGLTDTGKVRFVVSKQNAGSPLFKADKSLPENIGKEGDDLTVVDFAYVGEAHNKPQILYDKDNNPVVAVPKKWIKNERTGDITVSALKVQMKKGIESAVGERKIKLMEDALASGDYEIVGGKSLSIPYDKNKEGLAVELDNLTFDYALEHGKIGEVLQKSTPKMSGTKPKLNW